jgi:hypothetical protein
VHAKVRIVNMAYLTSLVFQNREMRFKYNFYNNKQYTLSDINTIGQQNSTGVK